MRPLLVVLLASLNSGLLRLHPGLFGQINPTTFTLRMLHNVITGLVLLERVLYTGDLLTYHEPPSCYQRDSGICVQPS